MAERGGAGRALRAPRGTFDVLPDNGRRRLALFDQVRRHLEVAGYGYADTPVFEDTELFARGVGASTDVVQKEMFTFEDLGGRSITLRPEGTAGICRAYAEHGMHKWPQPVKLWYHGPFFRYEAPQAGRFRQFTQIGAEALGSDDPSIDAELIVLLADLLADAGVGEVRLRLGSLGDPDTRREYAEDLRRHLRARESQLSDEVRARLDQNPLRAFDSDHPGTRAALEDAPRLLDRLRPEDRRHFEDVRALLDEVGVGYEIDATLVRGLDYYTRTVFEFTSDALGAQSGVGGGGRYDGLVEQLGGPPTPGVGWAAGVERILLAAPEQTTFAVNILAPGRYVPVYVACGEGGDPAQAFRIARVLRQVGRRAELEQAGRSLKGQLKHASRIGAQQVVVVDGDGLRVRDMATREERQVAGETEVLSELGVL